MVAKQVQIKFKRQLQSLGFEDKWKELAIKEKDILSTRVATPLEI